MVSSSRSRLRLLTFATATLAAASSFGIVATTTYGAAVDTMYPYVGYVDGFGGSGVAVGPNVFLTAGHVVAGGITGGGSSQTFTLGGTTYSIARSVAAPDILSTNPMTGQPAMTHVDLSLVYVNGTLPGYYNIGTSRNADSFTMVGYGQTGGVSADGLGYDVGFTSGLRLSGVNTIDAVEDNFVNGGSVFAGGPVLLSFLSQAGDAALGGGDSGGGWFQGNNLVGISDFTFTTDNSPTRSYGFASSNGGVEYFGSGAIDVTDPRLRSFFSVLNPQPTPEPASMLAVGVGALALVRRRRRS